jgi:hypothetical protein
VQQEALVDKERQVQQVHKELKELTQGLKVPQEHQVLVVQQEQQVLKVLVVILVVKVQQVLKVLKELKGFKDPQVLRVLQDHQTIDLKKIYNQLQILLKKFLKLEV